MGASRWLWVVIVAFYAVTSLASVLGGTDTPSRLASAEPVSGTTSSYFSEYQIKAGFIYRFISFVSWPEESLGDTITIGILGSNPFGDAFTEIKGSIVGDRTVRVRYYETGTSYEELHACQVLFVADMPDQKLRVLLDALSGSPVLTIGDSRQFVDKGGMIGFVSQDRRRIGIEINTSAAERAGLTIRSMLKRIASRIVDESRMIPNPTYSNG